jgi:DNA processing protein
MSPKTKPWTLAHEHYASGAWPESFRARVQAMENDPDRGRHLKHKNETRHQIPPCQFKDLGIRPLSPASPNWPENWNSVPRPPVLVYARGKVIPAVATLAVVGSRTLDPYAARVTRAVVREFAERFPCGQVVSGGAMGVDEVALRSALDAGLHPTVVLAGGVDRLHPRTLHQMLSACLDVGTVVSESYPGISAHPRLFPGRNRLISGLSDGLVVVRAADGSGSAHTIRHAITQKRPVLGVVGMIDDRRSRGIHDLIQSGAIQPLWKPADIHVFWP